MKRTALRRTPMKRGTRWIGQAARERVRAGGTQAVGRPALTREAWGTLVAALTELADGRCESGLCRRLPHFGLEPHHLVKRSAGGADEPTNILMLDAACHRQTDAPYCEGRLILQYQTSDAAGDHFLARLETRRHKGAPVESSVEASYIRRRS